MDWVNNHVFFVESETENSTSRVGRVGAKSHKESFFVAMFKIRQSGLYDY